MTGYDLYLRATAMLGMEREVADRAGLLQYVVPMLGRLCRDLRLPAPETVSEALILTSEQEEVLSFGLAMSLAQACGDGETHRYYAEFYRAKRAAVLASATKCRDVLPRDCGGVRI